MSPEEVTEKITDLAASPQLTSNERRLIGEIVRLIKDGQRKTRIFNRTMAVALDLASDYDGTGGTYTDELCALQVDWLAGGEE